MIKPSVVRYLLSNHNRAGHLQCRLALQCAPVLKNLKCANAVNLDSKSLEEIREIFATTPISCCVLSRKGGKCLILLYREARLRNELACEEAEALLEELGYPNGDLQEKLQHLRLRIYKCRCAEEMPHEIGVFLGYPIPDIKGFVANSGRDALLTRYWKVYDDPYQAELLFDSYDRAKTCAVNEILIGKTIIDLIAV